MGTAADGRGSASVLTASEFYGKWFAIRFCKAAGSCFSNAVLSLSTLHKYDGMPDGTFLEESETKKWLRQLERPKIFSRLKLFPIRKI